MFTRSSSVEPKTIEPNGSMQNPSLNSAARRPGPPSMQDNSGSKSVIGKDLKIIGQGLKIISQGTIQVDGEVEGDVRGSEVIIGDTGQVTGMVAAERVIVRGRVSGVIRGVTVALQSSSRVVGDIHHMSLAIEQGAEFDGRCKRPSDPSELNLDAPSGASANTGAPIPLPRAI